MCNVLRFSLVAAAFCLLNAAASAVDPDPALKKIFDKMIAAVQANDRDAFVANGTEEVRKGTTQEIMDIVAKALGDRLKKGYKAEYLCELKQVGHQVHLWKMTFTDNGDDIVIRMAMKDGKVAAFLLQ